MPVLKNMVELPGGTFRMGSDRFYPEERPVREVAVDSFWIDQHPVTVAEFRRFVKATGYVTVAEQPLEPDAYPDADPELLVPGSLVFRKTDGPVDLRDVRNWWYCMPGADWRHPEGPGQHARRSRTASGHARRVRGRRGLCGVGRARPSRPRPNGSTPPGAGSTARLHLGRRVRARRARMMANTWQGEFPWQNLLTDGFEGTSPVERFPPNGYGLLRHGGQRLGMDERHVREP